MLPSRITVFARKDEEMETLNVEAIKERALLIASCLFFPSPTPYKTSPLECGGFSYHCGRGFCATTTLFAELHPPKRKTNEKNKAYMIILLIYLTAP